MAVRKYLQIHLYEQTKNSGLYFFTSCNLDYVMVDSSNVDSPRPNKKGRSVLPLPVLVMVLSTLSQNQSDIHKSILRNIL